MDFNSLSDEDLDAMLAEKMAMRIPQNPSADLNSLSDEELDQMLLEKANGQQTPVGADRPFEAAVQGFGKAASFGYLPQIQAGAEKLVDSVFGDNTDEQLRAQGFQLPEDQSYAQRRDQYIKDGKSLEESNPNAYLAGGVGGGLASGLATGGMMGAGAKVATLGQRVGAAAKAGATIGALRNPGDTEGEVDLLQVKDRAENAAWDAITGVAVQGGLEGLSGAGRVIKNAGKNLKSWSQNKSLKAVGADKPAFKKAILNRKNTELGQAALDNKIVNPGDSVKDIAMNAEKALASSGGKIGKIYDRLDNGSGTRLRKDDIRGLSDDYINEAADRLEGTVDGDAIADKIAGVLETLPRNATFKELRKWRSSIDDQINFAKANNDLPGFQKELLQLRNKVQDKVANLIQDPVTRRNFIKENKNYSQLSEIKRIADLKVAGMEGNATFGMKEGFGGVMGSVVGSAIGGPVGAGAGAVLGAITTNVAKKYGTPFVAIASNRAARALESNKELLGKFADPLIKASKSPAEFVATVDALMKEPEFKAKIQNINVNKIRSRGLAKSGGTGK